MQAFSKHPRCGNQDRRAGNGEAPAFSWPGSGRPWRSRFRPRASSRHDLAEPLAHRTGRYAAPAGRRRVAVDTAGRRDLGAGTDADHGPDRDLSAEGGQKSSTVVDPAMPTWATITQWRPITTLWAIWTRLSIFVPSPITVSRLAPRSTVELAPISTSSWMITRPIWGP